MKRLSDVIQIMSCRLDTRNTIRNARSVTFKKEQEESFIDVLPGAEELYFISLPEKTNLVSASHAP